MAGSEVNGLQVPSGVPDGCVATAMGLGRPGGGAAPIAGHTVALLSLTGISVTFVAHERTVSAVR